MIARRNNEGAKGKAVARKMVEGGGRVFISYDGYTAVLSLYKFEERSTWLLTGWQEKTPDAKAEVYDSTITTSSVPTRFQNEEGAGISVNNVQIVGADGKPLFQSLA